MCNHFNFSSLEQILGSVGWLLAALHLCCSCKKGGAALQGDWPKTGLHLISQETRQSYHSICHTNTQTEWQWFWKPDFSGALWSWVHRADPGWVPLILPNTQISSSNLGFKFGPLGNLFYWAKNINIYFFNLHQPFIKLGAFRLKFGAMATGSLSTLMTGISSYLLMWYRVCPSEKDEKKLTPSKMDFLS